MGVIGSSCGRSDPQIMLPYWTLAQIVVYLSALAITIAALTQTGGHLATTWHSSVAADGPRLTVASSIDDQLTSNSPYHMMWRTSAVSTCV
jgi:hypothetical protein